MLYWLFSLILNKWCLNKESDQYLKEMVNFWYVITIEKAVNMLKSNIRPNIQLSCKSTDKKRHKRNDYLEVILAQTKGKDGHIDDLISKEPACLEQRALCLQRSVICHQYLKTEKRSADRRSLQHCADMVWCWRRGKSIIYPLTDWQAKLTSFTEDAIFYAFWFFPVYPNPLHIKSFT